MQLATSMNIMGPGPLLSATASATLPGMPTIQSQILTTSLSYPKGKWGGRRGMRAGQPHDLLQSISMSLLVLYVSLSHHLHDAEARSHP